jgi:hypothetical protein
MATFSAWISPFSPDFRQFIVSGRGKLGLIGLISVTPNAKAQKESRWPTGDEFLQACQAGDKACSWLVLGVAEIVKAFSATKTFIPPIGFDACIPTGTNADTIMHNVIGSMLTVQKIDPQLYQIATPASLIASTLAQVYPCKRE